MQKTENTFNFNKFLLFKLTPIKIIMKKYIILPFFSLFFILTIHSQDFGSNNASWHYSSSANGLALSKSEYIHYKVVKDTLFHSKMSKKIEIQHFKINTDTLNLPPIYVFTQNDSVFYYNDQYQRYLLLYDFTAHVNDTLQFYIPDTNFIATDSTFKIVIDSIIPTNFGGQTLSFYHSSPLGSFSYHGGYIEKIGSKEAMLPQPTIRLPESDGPIRCFEDTALFVNFSTVPCDFLITSLIEISQKEFSLLVYPNPSSDFISLKYSNAVKVNEIAIIDINGKLIRHYDQGVKTIKTQDLENGIYFLQLTSNYGKYTEKIIINH